MSAYVRQSAPEETDQERIERLEAELAHLRKVSGHVVNCWAAAEVGEMPQMMNASIPALRDALQARSKGESVGAAPAEPQAPLIMGYFTVKQYGACQLSIGKISADSQALMSVEQHQRVVTELQAQLATVRADAALQAKRLAWVIAHAELREAGNRLDLWTIRELVFDGVGELDTGTKAGDILAAIDAVLVGPAKA